MKNLFIFQLVDYYRETEKTIEKAKDDYLKNKVPLKVISEVKSREQEAGGEFHPIFDNVLRRYDLFQRDLKGFWNICKILDDESGGFNYILDDWNINFRGEKGEKIVSGATDDEDDDLDADTDAEIVKDEIVAKEVEEEVVSSSAAVATDEPPIKREKIELTEEDPLASSTN